MKTKIIKQERNPFLEREELVLEITKDATPTYDEVIGAVGKENDLTVVKKVHSNFGRQTFLADVVVYDNKEAKDKVEVIPQKVRKKMEADRKAAEEEAKKKVAAEAEAKKAEEEAAKEENTEETKEEEKTAPLGEPQSTEGGGQ